MQAPDTAVMKVYARAHHREDAEDLASNESRPKEWFVQKKAGVQIRASSLRYENERARPSKL